MILCCKRGWFRKSICGCKIINWIVNDGICFVRKFIMRRFKFYGRGNGILDVNEWVKCNVRIISEMFW